MILHTLTMTTMTHPDSAFEPFSLPLANGATLTGIVCIPEVLSTASPYRPLMVLMHGGSCNAHHYDVDQRHTASLMAKATSVPVVSINRPGYRGTSSAEPIPEGSFFHVEMGRWEHEFIFPALWDTYGVPNKCRGLVAVSHSLAMPGLIIAASLYAQTPKPSYPLAGIIGSGWGVISNKEALKHRLESKGEGLKELKFTLMLSDEALHTSDESVRQYMAVQTETGPVRERTEFGDGTWESYWRPYAAKITVPIMYGIGEHDWLWQGSSQQVDQFRACFPTCPRFDGSVVRGAPHAIEWSHCAQGWYARCFGFGLEVVAGKCVQEMNESL